MRVTSRYFAAALMSLIALTTVARSDAPKEGDSAPDLRVKATQVKKVLPDSTTDTLSIKDFQGKKHVVLFYFPKALTKGWTIESCGFRDILDQFAAADTVVIGFSSDTVEKQQEFTDKESLSYPLLADTDKKLMGALGVKGRATWVIDKSGKISKIYDKVNVGNHPKEVLEYVKTLKK
jgi:thioredoxin-dependent peroxiredoxin